MRPLLLFGVIFATPVYGQVADQINDPDWTGGAVNVQQTNNVSQGFVPTLPLLRAVEVNIQTGNPERGGDTLTMSILGSGGETLSAVSQSVPEGFDGYLRFEIPAGGIALMPSHYYTIRVHDTGKNVFWWKYQGGDPYPPGQAFFFGSEYRDNDFLFKTYGELVPEVDSTPCYQHTTRRKCRRWRRIRCSGPGWRS